MVKEVSWEASEFGTVGYGLSGRGEVDIDDGVWMDEVGVAELELSLLRRSWGWAWACMAGKAKGSIQTAVRPAGFLIAPG